MKINEILYKYENKKRRIIMRKKETLDFSIRAGIIKRDIRIYVDFEKICIENTTIKMNDLETMYIFGSRNKYGEYACTLEVKDKNPLNSISLTITGISDEDVEKIDGLFKYFMFSDEVISKKSISDLYVPLLSETNVNVEDELKKYESEDIFMPSQEAMLNETICKLCFPILVELESSMNDEIKTYMYNEFAKMIEKK